MKTPRAVEILLQSAETYRERNAVYGDNFRNMGPLLMAIFPSGIRLETEADHNRFSLFSMILGKLTRYANSWTNGHQDSIHDIIVYAAILEMVDEEVFRPLESSIKGPVESPREDATNCVEDAPAHALEPVTVVNTKELPLTRQTHYIYWMEKSRFYVWEDGEYQPLTGKPGGEIKVDFDWRKNIPTRSQKDAEPYDNSKHRTEAEEELASYPSSYVDGHVNCPCWKTGNYIWVRGCKDHPVESMT